ncbi:MAG: mannonate dehydratase [Planctomycetia bacterium]|nr:mannonate dehydratase [Planctomycetia bacterium]
MKLTMFLPFEPDLRWELARQAGVTHAVVKLAPELTGRTPPWDIDVLAEVKRRFTQAGFVLYGLEGDQFDMSRIKLGLDGRDEDIARYRQMLDNMGELQIPLLCYNFMVGVGWFRTKTDVLERGGALTCRFDANDLPPENEVLISPEKVWDNYSYFIQNVIGTAEKASVRMGLHPDDPPVPCLKGYSRIFGSAAGYDKAMSLSDSPSHGITFCQANFFAAGENVLDLIRRWSSRIVFYHFRDVRGVANAFTETFHDNGEHDMNAVIRTLVKTGFDGPIRTDHAPSMASEGEATGYNILGHLFALGYLKGLLDANTSDSKTN